METLTLIAILLVMGVMMFITSRSSRNRQRSAEQFRKGIVKGDEVMTGSGLIGVIEGVDLENNSVIINSEGTKTRWLIDAITKLPKTVSPNAIKGSNDDSKITSSAKTTTKKPALKKK